MTCEEEKRVLFRHRYKETTWNNHTRRNRPDLPSVWKTRRLLVSLRLGKGHLVTDRPGPQLAVFYGRKFRMFHDVHVVCSRRTLLFLLGAKFQDVLHFDPLKASFSLSPWAQNGTPPRYNLCIHSTKPLIITCPVVYENWMHLSARRCAK